MNSENSEVISAGEHKSAHPIVFLFLLVPYGMVSGYLTVTLAYLFSGAGITTEMIAALVGAMLIPQIFKFLWAPVVDVTFSVKGWYVFSTFVTAAIIFVTGLLPIKPSVWPLLTILIVAASIASTFVGAAANNLSAYDTPESKKGQVSGFVQAGNLGGGAVGGGLGLFLAQHFSSPWLVSGSLALICILCCIGLVFVKSPQVTIRVENLGKTMANVLTDTWQTVKNKTGILAMILCLMPMGTCAAANLFAAIAKDWHASANTVIIATGIICGFVTSAGCLIGGWFCDMIEKRTAYMIAGLLQAICCIGMAFFPHTENMYLLWTLAYSVTAGLAYAAFNAFTLQAIGKGAAATKFELYAGVSNTPICVMTFVSGIAYAKWGASGMLNTEALLDVVSIVLFMIIGMAMKTGNRSEAVIVVDGV